MRLLLIGDHPGTGALQDFLELTTGPDRELFSVDEMKHTDALTLAPAILKRYDAILLEEKPGGGAMQVVQTLIATYSASPVIVYAARGDLSRCVSAMRAGAWDYFRTGSPDDLRSTIINSLRALAERRKLYSPDPVAVWIDQHFEELERKYPGKYIVIHEDEIVEVSDSYATVAAVVRTFRKGNPIICHVPQK